MKPVLTMKTAAVMVVAPALLAAAGPGSAVAGVQAGRTPQCAEASFLCITPVLYRGGEGPLLAMAVPHPAVNAPIVVEWLDSSDPGQDWILEPIGARPPGARPPGARAGGLAPWARGGRRRPAPLLAYLEYAPGGLRSDLCAANVGNRLVLRRCNGSDWQVFIDTPGPAGGGIAPASWFYFVSDVKAAATGQHLAMTAARVPGAPVIFAAPGSFQDQWWGTANHCLFDLAPAWSAPGARSVLTGPGPGVGRRRLLRHTPVG